MAHKYPFKYQVNEMAFTRDGKHLLLCTGQGERRPLATLAPFVTRPSRTQPRDVHQWVSAPASFPGLLCCCA